MSKFIEWLKGSADNNPGGASSKKLSAFWALVILASPPVIVWTTWAYKHNDWSLLTPVLTLLLAAVGTFLGINSIEKIKGKANATQDNINDNNDRSAV